MPNTVAINTNQDIYEGKSYAYRFPVPVRRLCPVITPPFVFPGGEWNCNLCQQDSAFFVPWNAGDLIPLAFTFPDEWNTDIRNPAAGWTDTTPGYIEITIYDCACNEIVTGAHNVSECYYVSWCERTQLSQQVIFIDTRLLPASTTCFKIEIRVLDFDNNEIYCIISNEFNKNECSADGTAKTKLEDTVLIESKYHIKDCANRCYEVPENEFGTCNDAYYNAIRVPGVFAYAGPGEKTTSVTDLDYVLSTTTTRIYRLETCPLPPYMAEWLSVVLESDNEITINGITFSGQNVSIAVQPANGNMLCMTVDFTLTCDIDNTECS